MRTINDIGPSVTSPEDKFQHTNPSQNSTKTSIATKLLYSLGVLGVYGLTALTPVGSGVSNAQQATNDWVSCGNEGGACRIPSRYRNDLITVMYGPKNPASGVMTKFMFFTGLDAVKCETKAFGDGAPNKLKACSYADHNPMGINMNASWTYAKNEGGTFYLPNNHELYVVRYGLNGKYTYQYAQPGQRMDCTNNRFGNDIIPGVKKCHYYGTDFGDEELAESSSYSYDASDNYHYGQYKDCANQDNNCNLNTSLPVLVRYGVGNKLITHVAAGDKIRCHTDFFDYDPDNNNWKDCQYRKLTPTIATENGPVYGNWYYHADFPADPETSNTWGFDTQIGSSTTITEASSKEMSYTVGASFSKAGKIDSGPVESTSTLTFSFQNSWGTSESFSEAFSSTIRTTERQSCTVSKGFPLWVWEFRLHGDAERCLVGVDEECDLTVYTNKYVCTSSPNPPLCAPGDTSCGITPQPES